MDDYFELKIKINPEISEILSDICFENFECEGIVLAEEEYKDELVLVSTTEDTLKVYLKSDENVQQIIQEQRQILLSRGFSDNDLGSWDFEISKMENLDWSKKWKENWTVTKVTDKIYVVPTWLEHEQKDGEIVIDLDPSSAFGTGTHPTTQLCMVAMERFLEQGAEMADIGVGSGILTVCGIKLGAKSVYANDNDPLVIEIAKENANLNKVADKCYIELNTADKMTKQYDFVCANIIHYTIAEIMGDLKNIMKTGGKAVLSGILDEKGQIVIDAIEKHNLKIIDTIHQDIWVAFVVEK